MTQADNDQTASGARATASQATARATETIDTNPLAVLAGGLALGAIAGAMIPRTDRERDLLRPAGAKLGATAAAAFAAAKEAGMSEMETRGLTKDSARDQVKTLLQSVGKAATGAATAAVKTAKQEATGAEEQPDSTGGNGDSVPPIGPHHQVVAGEKETSFSATV
jgi:hypothetical protein